MEELKTAIGAMKKAEEALAKEGFILHWNVRVKAERSFFKKLINAWISEDDVPPPEAAQVEEPAPEKKTLPTASKKEKKALPPEAAETVEAEVKPEPPAVQELSREPPQKPNDSQEEERPVTALDISGAATYLGVSVAAIYDLAKRGRITAHGKMGDRWYKIEDLDRYSAEREKRRAAKKALEAGVDE